MPRPSAWLAADERWDAIPRRLWSAPVSGHAKALFACLCSIAHEHMGALAPLRVLARVLARSPGPGSHHTVKAALRELVDAGMIRVTPGGRCTDGTLEPTLYTVLAPHSWGWRQSDTPQQVVVPPTGQPVAVPVAESAYGENLVGHPLTHEVTTGKARSPQVPSPKAESARIREYYRYNERRGSLSRDPNTPPQRLGGSTEGSGAKDIVPGLAARAEALVRETALALSWEPAPKRPRRRP